MATRDALCGRLQKDIDLKSTARGYYKVFRSECHTVPKASPGNIQAVSLHEGDWHTHGAIKIWKYTIDGKTEVLKEKVEFDDNSLTFTIHGMEGDALEKYYKVYKATCKLVPKAKGCVAKLAIEYERLNEDAPIPNGYMDIFVNLTLDVDAHAFGA